jgi:hypothetical protein
MPCVGFEYTIPTSERAETVHALDLSATVTGYLYAMEKISFFVKGKLCFCGGGTASFDNVIRCVNLRITDLD